MPNELHIAPNRPLHVALVDPEGQFDFELQVGRYQTTTGQTLTLPRPAVVILNTLAPRPGEELVITKLWSGRPGEPSHWTIALSTHSEMARAELGEADTLTEQLEASLSAIQPKDGLVEPPTPIRKPVKPEKPTPQPRLFDRGTGTDGPAPLPNLQPAAMLARKAPPGQIPANVAVQEILSFVSADPGTANWSADARQDLCSTILIASFKAGYIGLWQRGAK